MYLRNITFTSQGQQIMREFKVQLSVTKKIDMQVGTAWS